MYNKHAETKFIYPQENVQLCNCPFRLIVKIKFDKCFFFFFNLTTLMLMIDRRVIFIAGYIYARGILVNKEYMYT